MKFLIKAFFVGQKKAEQVIDSICNLSDTLVSSVEEEILELDELCSFVFCKNFKSWLWIALCRRTRQIVAFHLGNRSARSCKKLWDNVPENYKHSITFSDFWKAYKKIIKTGKHHSVGKDSGQTNHVERWNNTLRQRVGRFVRKTLSFSKSYYNHFLFTYYFIINYNKEAEKKYLKSLKM